MGREAEGENDLFRQWSTQEGPQVIEDSVAEWFGITLGSVPGLRFGRFQVRLGGIGGNWYLRYGSWWYRATWSWHDGERRYLGCDGVPFLYKVELGP